MTDIANNLHRYLVGGSVRDELLDIPNHDRDWVVVGSTEAQLLELGFERIGRDFPVFLHPQTKEEYALARQERKQGSGYRGFVVDANKDISLEQDLLRRDLTINAMARSVDGEIIDPYNGRADLEARVLRHVSDAFAEDPLRVLRVARFAARFHSRGFTVAPETMVLMKRLVDEGEIDELVSERVWAETSRALDEDQPSVYFETLRACGALKILFPEIDGLFGVPQPERHHPEIDSGIHTMMVVDCAAAKKATNRVRFSALVHDLGKATTPASVLPSHHGHEARGVPIIDDLCERLRVPNDYRRLARVVSEHHLNCHRIAQLRPQTILKMLDAVAALKSGSMLDDFLEVCECDARGRKNFEQRDYPQAEQLRRICDQVSAVTAADIKAQSPQIEGKRLGEEIYRARLNAVRAMQPLAEPAQVQPEGVSA